MCFGAESFAWARAKDWLARVFNEDDRRVIFGLDETGELEWLIGMQYRSAHPLRPIFPCILYSAPSLRRLGSWS